MTRINGIGVIVLCLTGLLYATPFLNGDGLSELVSGNFGEMGSIYEFGLYGTSATGDLSLSSTISYGSDYMLLSFSMIAGSNLSDVRLFSFLDAEIDEGWGLWDNEMAEILKGTGGANQCEIDEPGSTTGDIYDNFEAGQLDNGFYTSLYSDHGYKNGQDDIAMALGFLPGFISTGSTLKLELMISESMINRSTWGTVLHQWDADLGQTADNLYFAGRYTIIPSGPQPVPESGVFSFLVIGLSGGVLIFGLKKAQDRVC